VIAGQGTIGLELLEDLSDLDTVLVPLSGGGLLGEFSKTGGNSAGLTGAAN
jgi:threonine dehydratase